MIHKLTQSAGEAKKGMLDMATKLRELRGLPEVTQRQLKEQQTKATGKDGEAPEPLMTRSHWEALLDSNKTASSLPPAPVKGGLFMDACEKVKTTLRQILQFASPAKAIAPVLKVNNKS